MRTDDDFPSPDALHTTLTTIPGAPILSCSATTIGDYACGAYELCVRDLQMALGDTAAPILAVLSSAVELPQAFGLRNEMCSLKKCTFFVLQQASSLERQLLLHGWAQPHASQH